jgi:hypothetical protein
MKYFKYIVAPIVALAFFSCTVENERQAARLRFMVNPNFDGTLNSTLTQNDYRKLAELIYEDSVMLPALRELGIAVTANTNKLYRDSILVTKAQGYYDESTHDLVVWQCDGERAFQLVDALYRKLIFYYDAMKAKQSYSPDSAVSENVVEANTTTTTEDLNNQLEKLGRRMERWRDNPDSMQQLEAEKAELLAQYDNQVEANTISDTENASYVAGPYSIYTNAEHLGLTRMPTRKK